MINLCQCKEKKPVISKADDGTCCLTCDTCCFPIPDDYLDKVNWDNLDIK